MSRRWFFCLPLTLALAGGVILPASASAADPVAAPQAPPAACADLNTALTGLVTDAMGANPAALSQGASGLLKALMAAAQAGCVPTPAAKPATAATPATPGTANQVMVPVNHPQATPDSTACLDEAEAVLAEVLGGATGGSNSDPMATLSALQNTAAALVNGGCAADLPAMPTSPTSQTSQTSPMSPTA